LDFPLLPELLTFDSNFCEFISKGGVYVGISVIKGGEKSLTKDAPDTTRQSKVPCTGIYMYMYAPDVN